MRTWIAGIAWIAVASSGCTVHTYSTPTTTPHAFRGERESRTYVTSTRARAPRVPQARVARPEPVAAKPATIASASKPKPVTIASAPKPKAKPATIASASKAKPVTVASASKAKPVTIASASKLEPRSVASAQDTAGLPSMQRVAIAKHAASKQRSATTPDYARIIELARRTRAETESRVATLQVPEHGDRERARTRMATYAQEAASEPERARERMVAYTRSAAD